MLSFNSNSALKQQIIEYLINLPIEDTVWKRSATAWDGNAGSLVGHVIKSEDLADWENLGLPKWLALTIDYFLIVTTDLKQAIEMGVSIIKAIPVGQDIQKIGSQYLIALAIHEQLGIQKVTDHDVLSNALNKVISIQQQCLENTEISASAWRSLRKEMIENSEQFHEDSLEYLVSLFTEAAAWNPITSRTAVSDSVRVWGRVKSKAEPSPDWTQEREDRVRALLDKLHKQEKAKQPEGSQEFIDVFKLLEQYEPEESTWLKAEMKWGWAQPAVLNGKAAKLLAELLMKAA